MANGINVHCTPKKNRGAIFMTPYRKSLAPIISTIWYGFHVWAVCNKNEPEHKGKVALSFCCGAHTRLAELATRLYEFTLLQRRCWCC